MKKNKVLQKLSVLLFLVFLASCTYYTTSELRKVHPDDITRLKQGKPFVTIKNEYPKLQVYEILNYQQVGDTIIGELRALPDPNIYHRVNQRVFRKRGEIAPLLYLHLYTNASLVEGPTKIAISNVNRIETHKVDKVLSGVATTGAVLGSTVGGVVALLAIACNCPHIYVDNGEHFNYDATLFTGAVTPNMERYDYKSIPDYFPDSSDLDLRLKNEDLEDQYVNKLELWVVEHDIDEQIITDQKGNIYAFKSMTPPTSAINLNGGNVLSLIESKDEQSYLFDGSDKESLSSVQLTFDNTQNLQTGQLVLRLKNHPWSAVVYNEFQSLFGDKFQDWVKENSDLSSSERIKWMSEQGFLVEVEYKSANGWTPIDSIMLLGDVSYQTVAVPFEIESSESNIEIRLRSGFMFWELDYAGISYGDEHSKVDIIKIQADHKDQKSPELMSKDNNYLILASGDEHIDISFKNLPLTEGKARSLFIKSSGYYTINKTYTGKMHKKELLKFKKVGAMSEYSKELYNRVIVQL